jgi:hypothetical protein
MGVVTRAADRRRDGERLAPEQHAGVAMYRQEQQLIVQPVHSPQHDPAAHPQVHAHLGSSQQHRSEAFVIMDPPGSRMLA